jgi:hypothetical protein
MTPEQKNHISRLLREYSGRISTEKLIHFVADTNGMISACRALLEEVKTDRKVQKWLEDECGFRDAEYRLFLDEVALIITLFHPEKTADDNHAVLGLEPGASPERIKQAYRRLSMKYHPDTAASGNQKDNSKFIKITIAYQALQETINTTIEKDHGHSSQQWRTSGGQYASAEQKKWFWVLLMSGVVMAFVVIAVVSMNYRKRVMIIGLQQGRGSQTTLSYSNAESAQKKSFENVSSATAKVEEGASLHKEESGIQSQESESRYVQVPQFSDEKIVTRNTSVMDESDEERLELTSRLPQPDQELNREGEKKSSADTVQSDEILAQSSQLPLVTSKPRVAVVAIGEVEKTEATVITTEKVLQSNDQQKPYSQTFTKIEKKSVNESHSERPQEETARVVKMAQKPISPLPVENHQHKRAPTSPEQPIVQSGILAAVNVDEVEDRNKEENWQERIDIFLREYNAAYEERNIILFSRFFEVNAIENGEPFIKMMGIYNDLFESTSSLSLRLDILRRNENAGEFELTGRFKVHLEYKNGDRRTGTGPIKFILRDVGDALRIKELDYTFNG